MYLIHPDAFDHDLLAFAQLVTNSRIVAPLKFVAVREAIAIAVGLACASASFAQTPGASITSTGVGNAGYIEQDSPLSQTATISQNGDNNTVGVPGTAVSGGVYQLNTTGAVAGNVNHADACILVSWPTRATPCV